MLKSSETKTLSQWNGNRHFRSWYRRVKKSLQGIERALFVARDLLPNRPTVWLRRCYAAMQQHKWISGILIRIEYSSFSSDFKISSCCFSNHLQCNGNCVLRPDLWAISRTITKTMALQSSPKRSTAMKPAQKSDFSQVWLKQTHYVNIMLQLLPPSVTTRASAFAMDKSRFNALNYLWVTTLSPRVPNSYSDWSKSSDPFLGRENWHQSSMKSPSSLAILNLTNDFWKSTQLPQWEEEHKGKVFGNVDLS